MCGFLGAFSNTDINISSEQEKNKFLICRGPDEYKIIHGKISDYFQNEDKNNLIYQFNRLSILDLSSKASQPMISKKYKTILMFNGEIYNHLELRKSLEKEGVFFNSSHSDSEVILNGLSVHGKKFINQLRGQFAIAFYDSRKKELILTRDRLGQKPLYYKLIDGSLHFGSNLKSIYDKKHDEVRNSSLEDYLNYGVIPSPNTIFKNIFKIEPAQIITFDFSRKAEIVNKEVYWKLENYLGDDRFSEEEFFEKYTESIEIRESADVEVATFLSGGIDSSSIVKNMHDRGKAINTYSIGYKDRKYDESKWSSKVAENYNTNHIQETIEVSNDFEDIVNSITIFDEPYADPSTYPSYLISQKISEKYKVAISGDGGDELLGGYTRIGKLTNPNLKKSNIVETIYSIYPGYFGTGNQLQVRSKNLKKAHASFFSDKKFLELLKLNDNFIFEDKFFLSENKDVYKSLLITEYKFFLSEMMLLKVDKTSMANSLEVRSPFVDHKLIEYVLSHESSYHNSNQQKQILKKYLSSDYDDEFIYRKKQGFVFNLENYIYENFDEILDVIKENKSGLNLELKTLNKLSKFRSRINAIRIWKILFLEVYFSSL